MKGGQNDMFSVHSNSYHHSYSFIAKDIYGFHKLNNFLENLMAFISRHDAQCKMNK